MSTALQVKPSNVLMYVGLSVSSVLVVYANYTGLSVSSVLVVYANCTGLNVSSVLVVYAAWVSSEWWLWLVLNETWNCGLLSNW